MGIGSLGMTELVAIFIIVLVAFGPRRFPEIARSMGSAMREFRRSLNQIQRELEEVDPRKDIPGKDILNDIRSGKPGNWLDPNRTSVPTGPPGVRSAPEAPAPEPRPGPEVTGEAAGAMSQEVSPGPAADVEQLPMFDGSTTDEPGPRAVETKPEAGDPSTEGSRSD
jgi:TatA/E family protein of Tat protein translocase